MQSTLERQLKRYEEIGLKENCGLTENNIIFRSGEKHLLNNAMELWWEEFKGGVKRDQISLSFVIFVKDINIFRIPFSTRDNNYYFRVTCHRKKYSIFSYIDARRYQPGIFQKILNFVLFKYKFVRRLNIWH
jgi:hypothetical protein